MTQMPKEIVGSPSQETLKLNWRQPRQPALDGPALCGKWTGDCQSSLQTRNTQRFSGSVNPVIGTLCETRRWWIRDQLRATVLVSHLGMGMLRTFEMQEQTQDHLGICLTW